MTGIFGVIGRVSTRELDEMGRRLAHRGSQAQWWRLDSEVHLGQVDNATPALTISAGHSAVIDRSIAMGAGATPESLLEALLSAGAVGLERLSTPFAIAVWDPSTRTLSLARDLAGLKPLFKTRLPGGGIAFATEYKSLLAIDAVSAEPDLQAVQYLQVFKLTPPGSATLFKHIHAVPPAAITQFDRSGAFLRSQKMNPIVLEVDCIDEQAASTQLRDHLIAATRRLVGTRSRIGVALSGGVDSLGLAHLCRKCAPTAELIGFTFSQGANDPEERLAGMAMRALDGELVTVSAPSSELPEKLPRAVWHLEDPIGRTESYLFFEVAQQAARRGFDALLSGMGADALFAGMPRYKVLWLADRFPWLRGPLLEFYDATQSGRFPRTYLGRTMTALYYRGRPPPVPQIYGTHSPPPEPHVESGAEYLNRTLLIDILDHAARTLPRIERPLYAYGLDHGSPFFDRQVIDFSFRVPSRLKIRRGKEKYILRRALQSLMSEELRNTHKGLMRMRQEAGFAAALETLADRYLSPSVVEARGWFAMEDISAIRTVYRQPRCHREMAMRLWTLVLTEIWAQTFVDRRGRVPGSV